MESRMFMIILVCVAPMAIGVMLDFIQNCLKLKKSNKLKAKVNT